MIDYFWSRKLVAGDCWIWTGKITKKGYGQVSVGGVSLYAHRRAWVISFGPVPLGSQIRHSCKNRSCFNPDHLFEYRPKDFWDRISVVGECWEWSGSSNGKGYGILVIGGRPILAHRHAYFLHFGVHPGPLFVRHACDNPPCIRPDHLSLGTAADNSNDMHERGRDNGRHERARMRKEMCALSK